MRFDEGDAPFEDDAEMKAREEEDARTDSEDSLPDVDEPSGTAVAVLEQAGETTAVAVATPVAVLTGDQADFVSKSDSLLSSLQAASDILQEAGAMSVVASLHYAMTKEKRKRRAAASEDPDLAMALARRLDAADSLEWGQRARAAELNDQEAKARALKRELEDKKRLLQKRAEQVQAATQALEDVTTRKCYSVECLGQGQARSGGAAARKLRVQVLDRLAVVGPGLSPEQRNDWSWFKTAWDARMVDEHKEDWGGTFARWIQAVVDDFQAGRDEAFSAFVHSETLRCFGDQPRLVCPGAP